MANSTIRNIDYRVADRLVAFSARSRRPTDEEACGILSRAVGIEPKSGFPPPPKGHPTPWEREGWEEPEPRTRTLTVRGIPPRVMRKLEASAARNKHTASAEARTIITQAIGFDRPLRKGEESAAEFLMRIGEPLRRLNFKIPPREEFSRRDSR